MNLFFPQVEAALVVRKTPPKNGLFVTSVGEKAAYVVPAVKCPCGCVVAEKLLGGYNFDDGTSVYLVYASTMRNMHHYRRHCGGRWIVPPRQHSHGGYVGLILSETGVSVPMGCTPVIAEQALSETE